jgi:hypothetical protein
MTGYAVSRPGGRADQKLYKADERLVLKACIVLSRSLTWQASLHSMVKSTVDALGSQSHSMSRAGTPQACYHFLHSTLQFARAPLQDIKILRISI